MSEVPERFLDVDLPEVFSIDVPAESMPSPDGWIPYWDYCERELFDRLDDGTYLCAGYGGSPIYLRVVSDYVPTRLPQPRAQHQPKAIFGRGNW